MSPLVVRRRLPVLLVVLTLLAAACIRGDGGSDEDEATAGAPEETGAVAADGLVLEVVAEGLEGPTQIAPHPDGGFVIAELGAGGEGEPTGRVSRIDLDDSDEREVLVEGLNTPTGVAVADGQLWIMEPTRLLRAPVAGGDTAIVFDDMPNNGRSNGTITTLADGTLLFDTAGRRDGNMPGTDSGTLWNLDPATVATGPADSLEENPPTSDEQQMPEDSPPADEGTYGRAVLDGMKHAYAATEFDDGRLAVTEMSDGTFDGNGAPDELLVITPEPDATLHGGWPRCIGNRQPVEEFDGTAAECEATVPSRALFDIGATPTGVAVAPWDNELVLVTNWTRDQIMGVALEPTPPVDPEVILDGVANPQHLLVDDRRVLVTAHGSGQILALTQA